jgi:hypothetical protein
MPKLPDGARIATMQDAQNAYDRYSLITKKDGYMVAITGSTLFGDGMDIDLIVVASQDAAQEAAATVANKLLFHCEHLYFYEEDEDGSSAAAVFLQPDKTVLDCYVYGLKYREVEDR